MRMYSLWLNFCSTVMNANLTQVFSEFATECVTEGKEPVTNKKIRPFYCPNLMECLKCLA